MSKNHVGKRRREDYQLKWNRGMILPNGEMDHALQWIIRIACGIPPSQEGCRSVRVGGPGRNREVEIMGRSRHAPCRDGKSSDQCEISKVSTALGAIELREAMN